jgi:hypothetical protein
MYAKFKLVGEQSPGELVLSSNLTPEEKAKILGLNVLEFFGPRLKKQLYLE